MDTRQRVQSLFLCYQLADSASIKSIQELLKMQFAAATLIRDAMAIILDNHGKKLVGESSKEMMERIHKISLLLPKSEKSIDSLKRFFNTLHTDNVLRTSLSQLLHPRCPSHQSAQCLRDILKRISRPPPSAVGSTAHSTPAADTVYEHTVKLLLERCASVLFDEAFGQELLTQLVVSRETLDSSTESGVSPAVPATPSLAHIELTRGLRILLALSVYHKETLPADDVLTHLQSVLASVPSNTMPEVLANTKTDEDPPTPTELSLQIICCMLGGGPIYGTRDAGGSGIVMEQHLDPDSLRASLTAESNKKATQSTIKNTSKVHGPGLYSGSASQLYEEALVILPWLKSFCTTGMTSDCPPLIPETAPPELKSPAAATATAINSRKRGAASVPSGIRKKKVPVKEKEATELKKNEEVEAAIGAASLTEAQAGLAWRRERRRAKLAVRVLRQLLSVAHSLAGPHSPFPKGPVSSLLSEADAAANSSTTPADDDGCSPKESTNADVSSPNGSYQEEAKGDCVPADLGDAPKMGLLEKMVQNCLDSIVKTCLACEMTSPHYVTSLTSLSHIGLLFPGVYNRQLKSLMTSQLIGQLLTKDSLVKPARKSRASVTSPDPGKPSDWTKDGNLSILTRAKIAAVKLMTNWLVGLQIQNKQVAQVIIRLLHRIIVHDGDLTCGGNMSYGEMSRMRLVAATSWLKVAHFQFYVEVIEVAWYQSMSYVLCDPCPDVRSHFLSVLHRGLLRLQLPLEYIAMFVHVADVQDNAFRQRAKQYLVANVKRRREFLNKHSSFTNNPKLLFAILPDFVLAYAIHLLAHDPDWSTIDDTARLLSIKSALWFVLEPIMSGANNYSFLRRILELIKHSRDALCPEDDLACLKMYVVCDIALGLLLTRCTNMVWKSSQFEIKLPRTLFVNAPPDFINPDFAQLYKPAAGGALEEGEPRVTFTPAKNARAVKEGLIPPKFLRHKAGTAPNTTPDNGDESKEAFAEAATQQDGVSVVVAPVISKPKKPKLTKKGTTRNQKKRAAKPSKKPLYVPSSSSPQVDLDEEQQQPVSQIAGSKELEIPAAPAATQLSAPDTRSSVTVPVTTGARKRLHSKSSPEVNGPMSVNDFEGLKTVDVTVAVNSKKRKFASPSDPHQAVAVAAADASPNVRSISSPRQANGVRPPIFRQGKLIFQKTARSATRTAAAASPSTKAGAKLRSTAAKSPKTSRRAPT
ncbi:unnamed protein product [Schistocephalus solidus]|uniref:Uncharacterized protein n=2 Tax=Schistocephalus solidus TaxID=70667 RepID=A0A3P7C7M0_SCHSO|nr:unnamed protein product [Schistocephalus solidus]